MSEILQIRDIYMVVLVHHVDKRLGKIQYLIPLYTGTPKRDSPGFQIRVRNGKNVFSYSSTKTYVVGTQKTV